MDLQTSTNYTVLSMYISLKDFLLLIKHRLTSTVVFSAGIGYILGSHGVFNWFHFSVVLAAGFFITAGANIANQVLERDSDKLMIRTQDRPVACGRVSIGLAVLLFVAFGISGVGILLIFTNALSAIIALSSFILYAFIYTPLKKRTRLSVLIGAIPGAAPPIIGYTAAAGGLDELGLLIFFIQFVWQFPHFWAIAWNLHDDYKKAGFSLLPSKNGRDKSSAMITLIVTASLVLISIYPLIYMRINTVSAVLILLLSLHFLLQAYRLFKTTELKDARRLMFGSFYYLPAVQIVLIIAKFINF